ncbi:MAG: serine/threonine-protein kinase [Gemmataceae bacterium]
MSTPPRPDETVDLPPTSTVDHTLPPSADPNATLPPEPPPADPNATLPPEPPPADPNATLGADPAAVDDRTCQLPADSGATVAPDEGRSTAAGSTDGFSLDASAASVRPGGGATASASGAQRIGNYEVLRELGRGAMGVVYQARHVALNRVVALKMVLAGAQASVMDRARFLIEAEAVARLQHPNIVQIFEIGDQNGQPFFSLEFCEGGTLSDRLTGGGLPADEAAGVVEQLARAMDAAHRHGVVHRDLKPANILLTAAGTPKVTDFGLAKRLGEDSKATRAGAIMGTPSYMAPEQAEGRTDDVGPPSDIYALGAILYDLLTGRPPFQGKTILETLTQVRRDEPTPPSRFTAKLPRDLETICLKCLAKDTRSRYLSAA